MNELGRFPDIKNAETPSFEELSRTWWFKPLDKYLPGSSEKADGEIRTNLEQLPLLLTQDSEVFGTEPFFHVTSDYALRGLGAGKDLLPPMVHKFGGIITHRRIGLHVGDGLLKAFGLEMNSKRSGMFAGPLIDAEQLRGEEDLASQDPVAINRRMIDLVGTLKFGYYHPDFLPRIEWLSAMHMIDQIGYVYDTDTSKVLTEKLLPQIHNLFLYREGWYQHLEQLFKGELALSGYNYDTGFFHLMEGIDGWEKCLRTGEENGVKYLGKGHGMILEIDPQILNERLSVDGHIPLLLSGRDPSTIRFMPFIPAEAIVTAYHMNPQELPLDVERRANRQGIEIRPIGDVPAEKWLGGVPITKVGPFESLDPNQALCDTRYAWKKEGTIGAYWKEKLTSGKVKPWTDFDITPALAESVFELPLEGPLPISEFIEELKA